MRRHASFAPTSLPATNAERVRKGAIATKQSILSLGGEMDCFARARNDGFTSRRHPHRRVTQYSRDVNTGTETPRRTGYPACAGYDELAKAARCANCLNRFPRIRHRRGQAAVDRKRLAVDVGSLVAGEEQAHRRQFVRLAGAL